MNNQSLNVCVVGAGPSGLSAAKELLDEGHRVTCLERSSRIGGVFSTGVSYRQMRLTVSQYFMAYSAMNPPLEQERRYWTREEYMEYLERFCERFKLESTIRFNAACGAIRRDGDGFVVSYTQANEARQERFDAVALCKGAFRSESPRLPSIPGIETFKGEIVHTSAYQSAERFAGKRVVCVGLGETSADITMHVADVAEKCWLSIRCFPNLVSRHPYGVNDTNDAWSSRLALWLPKKVRGAHFEAFKESDRKSDDPHRRMVGEWWLKSGGFGKPLEKNDDFVPYVLDGRITVIPQAIARLDGGTVEFTDGTRVEADALMLCTGYQESGIPPGWIEGFSTDDVRHLFKQAFHPDLGSRLAFIGWARPFQGGVPACSEMIARYFALLCSGKRELPPRQKLLELIAADVEKASRYFYKSPATRTLVDYIDYMETGAELVDCKPRLEDYLSDPAFLFKLLCGSNVPASYRLRGPHADPERARELIMRLPVVRRSVPAPDVIPLALEGRVDPSKIPEIQAIVQRHAAAA